MRPRLYLIYGTCVLSLLAVAQYRGWSLLRTNEVRDVPRTVRENPGAYRSSYVGSGRYRGGK